MAKILYHGSDHIVRKPVFGLGREYNDFGLGFYCTENPEHASEWAVGFGRNGFVSEYSLDCSSLRIIDLCSSSYCPLHWVSLLFSFREFDPVTPIVRRAKEYISREFTLDYQGTDCISGYRADNVNFTLVSEFLSDRLSYNNLKSALTEHSLGRQFVLKSNRAFDRILYTGYRTALSDDFHPASVSREIELLKKLPIEKNSGDFMLSQMIEEEIKSYDPRLR